MSSELTRVAWLSPFSQRSDISAFSRCVLPHLNRAQDESEFDCHLFVNENGESYPSDVPTMNIPHDGGIAEILSTYNAAIFNVGNNVENHGRIIEVLRKLPGIAVLHDFCYHHYFAYRCFEETSIPAAYARLMYDSYGSKGLNVAIRSGAATREGRLYAPWDSDHVADFPLLEPIASLASALVVHSRFMEERVRPFFHGPILRLFLPSDQKMAPSPEVLAQWREDTTRTGRSCLFVTFGHLSRSKCLDTIIRAFARSTWLRSNARLLVAGRPGDPGYVREIEALIGKLHLQKQVTLEYTVTDERLLAIKSEADIFINLRYPVTEGASGSLIEMLNAGKPVIAYRDGCYAEVPDNAAVLIERSRGLDAVVEAMEALAKDGTERIRLGAAAREYVEPRDSAEYARRLKRFILENRKELHSRARLVVPIRDARSWDSLEIAEKNREWFEALSRARLNFLLLENDPEATSPETFLKWPVRDLVSFVGRVVLHGPPSTRRSSVILAIVERIGRWGLFLLVSRLRHLQSVCRKNEPGPEDFANCTGRVPDPDFWWLAIGLEPAVVARLLYLAVLGRGWAPGEPDSWTAKLQRGMHPCAALLDFLNSAEYCATFPDNIMEPVQTWARARLAAPFLVNQPAGTIWRSGVSFRFSDADLDSSRLLSGSWYAREPAGCWSNGPLAQLRFMLSSEASGNPVHVILKARVAGARITGPRSIVAYANGTEVATLRLENDLFHEWSIPIGDAVHLAESMDLVLVANEAFCPAAAGQSKDKRELGIMLAEGRLVIGQPGGLSEAAQMGAHSAGGIEPVQVQNISVLPTVADGIAPASDAPGARAAEGIRPAAE